MGSHWNTTVAYNNAPRVQKYVMAALRPELCQILTGAVPSLVCLFPGWPLLFELEDPGEV